MHKHPKIIMAQYYLVKNHVSMSGHQLKITNINSHSYTPYHP